MSPLTEELMRRILSMRLVFGGSVVAIKREMG